MNYKSPFQFLDSPNLNLSKFAEKYQAYNNTLGKLFSETLGLIRVKDINEKSSIHYLAQKALHPSRIIRAITDYKVENPEIEGMRPLVSSSTEFGLDIYSKKEDLEGKLISLKEDFIKICGESILKRNVSQGEDKMTLKASFPDKSQYTAEHLSRRHKGDPLLFVALGHGGVAAGMDVYSMYHSLFNKDLNSTFYTIRFSMNSMKDEIPQISDEEIEYLQESAKGRKIVIFDEDIGTGRTFLLAKDFFRKKVFLIGNMHFVTNLDYYSDNKMGGKGGTVFYV